MQIYSYNHPDLGELRGVIGEDGVAQFRGIPFARIPERFKHSELLQSLDGYKRDFSRWGAACPQPFQGGPGSYGGYLPGEEENPVQYDEMSCLNLSVTLPPQAISKEAPAVEKLPVLVYVHGGAFCTGDSVCPLHDMIEMVRLSSRDGKPVIAVGIHYRLHFLGSIACKDLQNECEEAQQPICNFGLFDQQNAFLWMQKFLPGFGGNIDKITAFGESAGAMSISYNIVGPRPGLFSRAILMSGTCATGPPRSLADHEEIYLKLLDLLGIDRSSEDRLGQLRKVPVEEIVEATTKLRNRFFVPLADESFFSTLPTPGNTPELLANCSWIESFIIGDCENEGFIFSGNVDKWDQKDFISSLRKHFSASEEELKQLVEAYGLSESMDKNLWYQKAMEFSGDLVFSQPTHSAAKAISRSGKPAYRYIYTLPNPFPGSIFYNIPHHFLDILLVKLTTLFRVKPAIQRTSTQHCRYWLAFANGDAPWEKYHPDEEGKVNIIDTRLGGGAEWRIVTQKEDEESGRRYKNWEILEKVSKAGEEMVKEWIIHY